MKTRTVGHAEDLFRDQEVVNRTCWRLGQTTREEQLEDLLHPALTRSVPRDQVAYEALAKKTAAEMFHRAARRHVFVVRGTNVAAPESPNVLAHVQQLVAKTTATLEARLGRIERMVKDREHGRSATAAERNRWTAFLREIACDSRLSVQQRDGVLDIWQRAIEREPNVMYPTATITDEGSVCLSWNPPGRTIEVELRAGGRVEWFASDAASAEVRGSPDGGEAGVPKEFFDLLVGFVR